MAVGRIGRYERFILRPLSILLTVGAIAYFVQKAWGIGVLLVVMWFAVGAVGQALNRAKSFCELTEGSTPEECSSFLSPEPTPLEIMRIGRLSLAVFWIVGITVAVLTHHHGLRWLLSIPAGVAGGFVANLLGGWVSIRDVKP